MDVIKACGEVKVRLHSFLTSALDDGQWSASRPGCYTPGKEIAAKRKKTGPVGRIAVMDGVEERSFAPGCI